MTICEPHQPSSPGLIERRWSLWLLAIVVVGACLRIGLMDVNSFWFDEIKTSNAAEMSFIGMLKNRFGAGHPPAYFIFQWCSVRTNRTLSMSERSSAAISGSSSAMPSGTVPQ